MVIGLSMPMEEISMSTIDDKLKEGPEQQLVVGPLYWLFKQETIKREVYDAIT